MPAKQEKNRATDELLDDRPSHLIEMVQSAAREDWSSFTGGLALLLAGHKILNRHFLLAQREIVKLQLAQLDRLIEQLDDGENSGNRDKETRTKIVVVS